MLCIYLKFSIFFPNFFKFKLLEMFSFFFLLMKLFKIYTVWVLRNVYTRFIYTKKLSRLIQFNLRCRQKKFKLGKCLYHGFKFKGLLIDHILIERIFCFCRAFKYLDYLIYNYYTNTFQFDNRWDKIQALVPIVLKKAHKS